MSRIDPKPLTPEDMRYLDIGLANICECATCTDKRRLVDTIELLANELSACHSGNTDSYYQMDETAERWMKWSRSGCRI